MMTLVGSNDNPVCNESGCSFSGDSYFHMPVPTGMGTEFTIAVWVREALRNKATPFAIVNVRMQIDLVK